MDAATAEALRQCRQWIAELDASKREVFLEVAENSWSPIELWLYARVLGLDLPYEVFHRYAMHSFPKMQRRKTLNTEIEHIETDLALLRRAAADAEIKPDVATARIVSLTKELRGHIKAVTDITKAVERRGLTLAGADRVLRELSQTFKFDSRLSGPLEEAGQAAWAKLEEEL